MKRIISVIISVVMVFLLLPDVSLAAAWTDTPAGYATEPVFESTESEPPEQTEPPEEPEPSEEPELSEEPVPEQAITQLAAPTNLQWLTESPGTASWLPVSGAYEYYVTLYKGSEDLCTWLTEDTVQDLSKDINESGSYTFTVEVWDDEETYSAESPVYNYVRPAQSLSVPTNAYWDPDEAALACWDAVSGAYRYSVTCYEYDYDEEEWWFCEEITLADTQHDFSDLPSGTYRFDVRALSPNIETLAHSGFSAPSASLDYEHVLPGLDFGNPSEGTHKLRIELYDSYGDGWNDGVIEVYLNGSFLCGVTLPEDYEYEATANIYGLEEGDELTFVWVSGDWDDEVSFDIYCESYDSSFSVLLDSWEDMDAYPSDAAFYAYTVGDASGTGIGEPGEWEQDGVTWYYTPIGLTDCAVDGCDQNTGALTIPAVINGYTVRAISEYAFEGSELSSVVIPEGVREIGDDAFGNCVNLESVSLPDSLQEIGNWAFEYCANLQTITIPENVEYIGYGVFLGCSSLTAINVDADNDSYTGINGVLFTKDLDELLQYPAAKSGAYTVPSSVIEISGYAFADSAVTAVTLPSGLEYIGSGAFSSCNALTSVTIPASVEDIGEGAFESCAKLTAINVSSSNTEYKSVSGVLFSKDGTLLVQYPAGKSETSYSIPSTVQAIEDSAFFGCKKLTSVTIPASVRTIGFFAFGNCTGLTGVTISNGVLEIEDCAFLFCTSLKTVLIPASVEDIGYDVFYGCSQLTSITVSAANQYYSSLDGVLFDKNRMILLCYPAGNTRTSYTIPNSVGMINDWTFSEVMYLEVVIIPASVYYVGDGAFAGCGSLAEAHFRGSVPSYFGDDVFEDAADNFRIYYPQGASGWSTPTWNGYSAVPELGVPTLSSAVSAGYDSVALTWTAVPNADGYKVYWATSLTGTYTEATTITSGSTVNCTVTGLTAGRTYYFEVRAYKGSGADIQYGDYSSALSATPAPLAPTGVTAVSAGYESIRVSWNVVAGASGYELYRATSSGGSYSLVTTVTSLSYTNTGLSTGATYYFKVKAYRTVSGVKVYSGYSDIVSAAPALSPVTSVTASPTSPTSVKVSWGAVAGRTKYEVWRSTEEDGTYTLIGTTYYTYYTNTGLAPFTTYYYRIKVYRASGALNVYAEDPTPVTASARPILNNVTNVTAAMYSVTSNKISWSAVSGRTGYEVWWSESADSGFALLTSATSNYTSTYIYHKNLDPAKTYYYKVIAYVTVGGVRHYSTESAAVPAYNKVNGAKAVMYSVTSVKISWSAVSSRSGYEVVRCNADGSGESLVKTTTYTYFTVTSLIPNQTYYFKVRAYQTINDVKVYSGYSDVVSAMPVFNNVTNVAASMYSVTSNKISWSAVSGRTGYEVWWSESADSGFALLTSPTSNYTSTYIYHKNLDPAKTYYYKVIAYVTVGGVRQYSAQSAAVPAYNQVNGVKGSTYAVTSNKISWSAVSSRSGYEVWWSEAEDGEYTMLPVTTYTYIYHKGIDPIKTYYYKVRAYQTISGVKVYSGYSGVIAVTNKVNGAAASVYSVTSVKISWSAVSGRDGYELYRCDAAGNPTTLLKTTTYTYYTNTGLTTDTTYYYRVRAYDTVGGVKVYSGYSDLVSATPSLKAVTGAKASRYSSTKIKLAWSVVSGATGYEIQRCTTGNAADFVTIQTTTTTTAYYYDSGLTTGTQYYYRIRAYRTVGGVTYYGGWSTVVSATP